MSLLASRDASASKVTAAEGNLAPEGAAAQRRARLRATLIDAAYELVTTEGLASVQARRVAQMAGCSVGAIYNVFPDLDELILRANARTLAALGASAREAVAGLAANADVADRVGRLAASYASFAFAHETGWRSLFDYRLTFRKPYPDWYRAAQSDALAVLYGLFEGMENERRVALVETLWAAVHGVVSTGLDRRLRETSRADVEAGVALLTRLLAAGLERELAARPD